MCWLFSPCHLKVCVWESRAAVLINVCCTQVCEYSPCVLWWKCYFYIYIVFLFVHFYILHLLMKYKNCSWYVGKLFWFYNDILTIRSHWNVFCYIIWIRTLHVFLSSGTLWWGEVCVWESRAAVLINVCCTQVYKINPLSNWQSRRCLSSITTHTEIKGVSGQTGYTCMCVPTCLAASVLLL